MSRVEPEVEDSPNHEEVSYQSSEEMLDVRGDQFDGDEKSDVALLNLDYTDLWALGLTTAIGSHYLSWSSGLLAGFGSYIIGLALMSTAYFNLVLCISELSSALPFAGGAYGIARVTLGIYPGFLIACYDSCKSILCVASAAYTVGRIIIAATDQNPEMQCIYWLLFFVYCLTLNGRGGLFFWRINKLVAGISIGMTLVYIFGSIKFANFEKNATLANHEGIHEWFHGGIKEFMHMLPTTTRFFVGIQSIDVTCGQLKFPKSQVPKGSIGAIATVMITSFAVVFIACSLSPGVSVLQHQLYPLTQGYSLMFQLTTKQAACLSLPPIITYGMGYMYFYGKQLSAMGRSGLLPFVVGHEISVRNTPVVAHVTGAVLGLGICVLLYSIEATKLEINNLAILVAMVTYMSIFISFVWFRYFFTTIKREFTNPMGIFGAVYGFVIFAICFISVCGFQDTYHAISVFVIGSGILSAYYYVIVRKRQIFSEEERKVMFKAYVVKGNRAKNSRIKSKAATHQTQSSAQAHQAGGRRGVYATPSHSQDKQPRIFSQGSEPSGSNPSSLSISTQKKPSATFQNSIDPVYTNTLGNTVDDEKILCLSNDIPLIDLEQGEEYLEFEK